jgi:hypothetical protein
MIMEKVIDRFLSRNDKAFNYKSCIIKGDELLLVTPKSMDVKWDDTSKYFRSCLINPLENKVVSMGFKKYMNFGERPEFEPWDDEWKVQCSRKVDGSLLIVTKYKEELIVRTRGTTNARTLGTGYEIDHLIEKYPRVFDNDFINEGEYSLLLEWTSPNNVICIREHEEPTLTLLNAINNITGDYQTLKTIDNLSKFYCVERPEYYEFDSIKDCLNQVSQWEGKEGVVLFSDDYQTLKKIKSSMYLELHKMSSGLVTMNQILDMFIASPKFTEYDNFYKYVETVFDYEIAEKIKDFMLKICIAYKTFINKCNQIKDSVDLYIRPLESRKDQSMSIHTEFKCWCVTYAFLYLDYRDIDDSFIKKAMATILEI